MLSPEFFITALVVVLVPGTGVLYTVSTGLFVGRRASIAAAAGCTIGIIPHLTASILGLSALFHISAVAFQAIKIIGALYLFYLAWVMWRNTGMSEIKASKGESTLSKICIRGFLINILNPKLTMFFLAFLPHFILADESSPLLQLFVLSIVFMFMTFVIFMLYGISANGFRAYFLNSPKAINWLQKIFSATFAILGAKLIMSER